MNISNVTSRLYRFASSQTCQWCVLMMSHALKEPSTLSVQPTRRGVEISFERGITSKLSARLMSKCSLKDVAAYALNACFFRKNGGIVKALSGYDASRWAYGVGFCAFNFLFYSLTCVFFYRFWFGWQFQSVRTLTFDSSNTA